jgi:hypothetical protein
MKRVSAEEANLAWAELWRYLLRPRLVSIKPDDPIDSLGKVA